MNVLLLYPEFPDTFWSFKHALRFIHKRASFPPLGLLTVASMLPEDWRLRLVDTNVERLTDRDLRWADTVFISAMTVQRDASHRLIDRCKQAGLPVVAGGPLFTTEPEDFDQVDYLVLDEGEVTLPAFLSDWAAGCAHRIYRADDYADLAQTPVPRWDLLRLGRYSSMCVQYSRGCPFDCEFCSVTALLGHRPRTKDAAQIIADLQALYSLGWRSGVFFVDDNLIGNKRRLREDLLPALIAWRQGKVGVSFHTEASINLADDDRLMAQMVEAGFNQVFVGIETPDEESLAECSKRQNLNRDLAESVRRIHRAGLEVQGGFILGFDHDTPSSFQRLVDFVQKSGIVTAMVGLLQAPCGTRLYTRMQEAGRLLHAMSGDNTGGDTNIVPVMQIETLKQGYRQVLERLYSPTGYYARVRTFLSEYQPPIRRIRSTFGAKVRDARALIRSTIRLGVIGTERVEYWKLLAWTLANRPRLFPLAVRMAIYGFHFRKVYGV